MGNAIMDDLEETRIDQLKFPDMDYYNINKNNGIVFSSRVEYWNTNIYDGGIEKCRGYIKVYNKDNSSILQIIPKFSKYHEDVYTSRIGHAIRDKDQFIQILTNLAHKFYNKSDDLDNKRNALFRKIKPKLEAIIKKIKN